MELSLAKGWTQVEPKDTPFSILMSNQNVGQRFVASNTSFSQQRDLGFSGGLNCPIAVDHAKKRAFISVVGIVSFDLVTGETQTFDIGNGLSAVWMLAKIPDEPLLLMHTSSGEPFENYLIHLNLDTGTVSKQPLPKDAFFPLDVDFTTSRVLYNSRGGAAVFDFGGEVQTIASIDLSQQVLRGFFDGVGQRVVFGGSGISGNEGLTGWNLETGKCVRLSETGSCPQIDREGDIWFSFGEGALAKLKGNEAGFEAIVALTQLDTSGRSSGSYAQPITFSPDGRYGVACLTGKKPLIGEKLKEAIEFAKGLGRENSELDKYSYHHYLCVLDLKTQEVWCHEGYTHNLAWVAGDYFSDV